MDTALHRGGSGPPMVLLHGFTDTWRGWQLVLERLKRDHDVLAPTLAGRAGGPPLDGPVSDTVVADAVERAMNDAGRPWTRTWSATRSAATWRCSSPARGRARSVVALAPAGGWAAGDDSFRPTMAHFLTMKELLQDAAAQAEAIVCTDEGRRRATTFTAVNYEHIPAELLPHQMRGAAACEAVEPLVELALREGWTLSASPARSASSGAPRTSCWPGPTAAARYRTDWLPHADWVVLDDVGHCPQLDVPLETAQLIADFTAGP